MKVVSASASTVFLQPQLPLALPKFFPLLFKDLKPPFAALLKQNKKIQMQTLMFTEFIVMILAGFHGFLCEILSVQVG